jgi:NAD(P)-dependent dehydrogenase (short-subunit alcohol dehydrogenase family)
MVSWPAASIIPRVRTRVLDARPNSGYDEAMVTLQDRVVILTGASSGLGVHLADALDNAGAKLVLVARRIDRLNETAKGKRSCLAIGADVTDTDDVDRIINTTVSEFGRVDGLVNNAGVNNVAPALKEDPSDFRHVLEVNLVAPFVLSQRAARVMRQNGGGSIVNVTSTSASHSSSFSPEAGYVAAKSGLAGLTRELASQWARYNIRVNAVAPGAFVTEMVNDDFVSGDVGQRMIGTIPMQRLGRGEELSNVVVFLLDPSNSYLTGQSIVVDGGMTTTAC